MRLRPKNPPQPPSTLQTRPEDILTVDRAELVRIVFAASRFPLPWGEMRTWGPHPRCRWDPHPLPTGEHPNCGVLYTAGDLLTCAAEVFADTRVIDTRSDMPLLQVWEATHPLRLLDLTSTWALRNGASVSLDSARRSTCRAWARAIRVQLPDIDGLRTRSTMTGNDMTVLFSPARDSLPTLPRYAEPLVDATIYALLTVLAPEIGYEIV